MAIFDVSTPRVPLSPAGPGRKPPFTALSVGIHAVALGAALLAARHITSPTVPEQEQPEAIPAFQVAQIPEAAPVAVLDVPTPYRRHEEKTNPPPPPEKEDTVATTGPEKEETIDSPPPAAVVTNVFSTGPTRSLPPGQTGKVEVGILGGNSDRPRQPLGGVPAGLVKVGTLNGSGRGAGTPGPAGTVGPTNVFTAPGGRRREASPTTARLDTRPAQLLSPVTPRYTDEARRLGVTGDVRLRVLLDHSGDVRVLEVIQGLGHGLDQSATEAVNGTRCLPALENGRPIDVIATITVTFKLS